MLGEILGGKQTNQVYQLGATQSLFVIVKLFLPSTMYSISFILLHSSSSSLHNSESLKEIYGIVVNM